MSDVSPYNPPILRRWVWWTITLLGVFWSKWRFSLRRQVDAVPPAGVGVVICSKHTCSLDIPILAFECRALTRDYPFFQMGSFVGYPILGRMVPIFRACRGFAVMRPKEVRRLSEVMGDRRAALLKMKEINDEAEWTRRGVLERGETLVYFPEGTRDPDVLRPAASDLEVRSALVVAKAGRPVVAWPVTIALGPKKRFRRAARLRFGVPFPIDPELTAADVVGRVEAFWRETWQPADQF